MSTLAAEPSAALSGDARQGRVQRAVTAGIQLRLELAEGNDAVLADSLLGTRLVMAALASGPTQAEEPRVDLGVTALSAFLEGVNALKRDALTEEDEEAIPEAVVGRAVALATASCQAVPEWTTPRLATDGAGGIRMTWATGRGEVRAVIPAARPRYIYSEAGRQEDFIENFDEQALASQLRKIFGRPRQRR